MRKIIRVDMDAFYASVEQRDDPQLRGKPVIVAWKGNRSVVCAASHEARAFGVRSAMPAVLAQRLCPEGVFVPPDFPRYRAVSKNVHEIFKRHTDLIEPLSLDEAYLDVTENKTGLPTATLVARTIRAQIREDVQLTASAGVAPNKFLAKLASDWRKPDGLFVIQPEEVNAFLLPLPVGRLPGVGKVTEEKLARLGSRLWQICESLICLGSNRISGATEFVCTSLPAASMRVKSSPTGPHNRSLSRIRLSKTCRCPKPNQ
jgi:DNA polymerase IV